MQKNLSTIGLKYIHYSLIQKGYQSYLLHLPYIDKEYHGLTNLKEFVTQTTPNFHWLKTNEWRIS